VEGVTPEIYLEEAGLVMPPSESYGQPLQNFYQYSGLSSLGSPPLVVSATGSTGGSSQQSQYSKYDGKGAILTRTNLRAATNLQSPEDGLSSNKSLVNKDSSHTQLNLPQQYSISSTEPHQQPKSRVTLNTTLSHQPVAA
jgi:hypothetical protein